MNRDRQTWFKWFCNIVGLWGVVLAILSSAWNNHVLAAYGLGIIVTITLIRFYLLIDDRR